MKIIKVKPNKIVTFGPKEGIILVNNGVKNFHHTNGGFLDILDLKGNIIYGQKPIRGRFDISLGKRHEIVIACNTRDKYIDICFTEGTR